MSDSNDDSSKQVTTSDKALEEEKSSDRFNIANTQEKSQQPTSTSHNSGQASNNDHFLDKSNFKGIFSLKSKSQTARDRFNMKAQDYLESHKMSIYLQDAIKIILDRREDKPLDLLNEYFNTTLKGEHILLREYAFVSATPLNRKCFLQQVKKVFHSTPYYKVITALDYHQMLCLVCSDFPRSLMIDTVKALPIAGATSFDQISQKQGQDLLFESYDLDKLQAAVCVYFYFNEFIENIKQCFQESQSSSTLNINEQCSLYLIFNSINNLVQRLKTQSYPLPQIEAILEILLTKTKGEEKLKDEPLILVSDAQNFLSGNTISFMEFIQGMIRSKTLIGELYEPVFNKRIFQVYDQLKEIAAEQSSASVKESIKRAKTKKKK